MKKGFLMKIVTTMLLCTLMAGIIPALSAQAASLEKKAYDLAITETLNVSSAIKGKNKKLTYSYSSNKKAVATVNKKGVVTAKAAGKAKITVSEQKQGKKKNIGTITVTVHKAEDKYIDWEFTGQTGYYDKHPMQLYVKDFLNYVNPKATYTWASKDSHVKITSKGVVTHAEIEGLMWIPIIIKETYKGKTTTVEVSGIKFTAPVLMSDIYNFELDQRVEEQRLKIGETFNTYDWIPFYSCVAYSCVKSTVELTPEEAIQIANSDNNNEEDEDDGINSCLSAVYDSEGYWTSEYKGEKAGTYYVYYVAYNYLTDTYDNYFGQIKVVVTE